MILTFISFILKNGHFLFEPKEISARNKACEFKAFDYFCYNVGSKKTV